MNEMAGKRARTFLWILGLLPAVAGAQGGGIGGSRSLNLTNPIGNDFIGIAKSISTFLAQLAVPIAAVMVVVGAIQIMTAAGSPEKVSAGKKTILYAAIGLAVLLLADAIIEAIKEILG
jgi:predicted amino acid-binding ACT domain protein